MRILGLALLAAAFAAAQTPPNTAASRALVRGVLLERDPSIAGGQFSVRLADNEVLRYRFDAKTYVERNKDLIDVPGLRPGEKVEVVSDAIAGSALRYARTIHVIETPPPPQRPPRRYRPYRGLDDGGALPGGNPYTGTLTYSGVVLRLTSEHLVLHTRSGEESLQLRQDTRFLRDGDLVDAAALKPNTRVFVRAGKDLYDQVEVYQVVWGKILDPKP